jgi:hypothetical protein
VCTLGIAYEYSLALPRRCRALARQSAAAAAVAVARDGGKGTAARSNRPVVRSCRTNPSH